MQIEIEAARQPDVEAMLRAGEEFARSLYSEEECFMLDVAELERPGVTVWVARRDGVALGMASLVVGDEFPELKRLFVYDDARGGGVAGSLLDAVENHARDASARVIRLETGDRSTAAVALYEKRGYRHIPSFGDYVDSESSVCMELAL
jgi:putative acetyltransferase